VCEHCFVPEACACGFEHECVALRIAVDSGASPSANLLSRTHTLAICFVECSVFFKNFFLLFFFSLSLFWMLNLKKKKKITK